MSRRPDAKLAIGIDLGTTNCALAAVPLAGEDAPEAFAVPQVVHTGEVGARAMLPSFLYLPAEVELAPGALALPWEPKGQEAVGAYAQERGAQVPARVVSSAKSWLSFAGVDRRAPVLPWGAPAEVPKVSPVAASARYLAHLRDAWNHAHPDARLEDQDVVITVPASFDAVARELTVEAAGLAGLGDRLTLLEEPQAALYAWVGGGAEWRKQVQLGDVILVCDIGGGTTDFSLIAVTEAGGNLELQRVAVGDHILLGGDNMDLALAFRLKAKLEAEGRTVDDWSLRSLQHGCRVAKETLLAQPAKKAHPVVIPGRGSKLVGGTVKTELSQQELADTLIDGFFPVVAGDAAPQAARRVGLTTLGLPYASDAAVTRHLAAFLRRSGSGRPTALLFNGGVTKASPLCERLTAVLNGWLERPVRVLAGADPDLAVARGAAYYGRVRTGRGVRIRGGTARAYYVGIERAELAVPGVPPRVDAWCVAPFGMEEGTEVELPADLGLIVGEAAAFQFFASAARRDDVVGTTADPAALDALPSIETTLEGRAGEVVPVRLHARVTEVGTLELSAVENATKKRWKLEFDIRVD